MPVKKKILCIFQLCLGFIALLWIIIYPFLGSVYFYKSQMQPYDNLFSEKNFVESLDVSEKTELINKYNRLKNLASHSKLFESGKIFKKISPLIYVWTALSIILPLFLLFEIEGTSESLWLFPLICVFLLFANEYPKHKNSFVPTENHIVENYIKAPLANSISGQYEQLKQGWDAYLITEHAKETISKNPEIFQNQRKKGQFYFNLQKVRAEPVISFYQSMQSRPSPIVIISALIWGVLFAFFVSYPKKLLDPC